MGCKIKNILFDLGNVLIEWDPRKVYRQYWDGDHDKVEYFLANICTGEWNRQMDEGILFADAVAKRKLEFPEWSEAIDMWASKWEEMLGNEITLTADILRQMSKEAKYRLLALSNWSHETFPIALERYHFLRDCFEGIVVSGEIKMAKPDAEIFAYTLKRFAVKPEETLFIDDSLPNIVTAKNMGFETIHFTSAEQMQETMKSIGVL